MSKPNNAILLATVEGFDGGEVYVFATGLHSPSQNRKVGPSVEVWSVPATFLTDLKSQTHVCRIGDDGEGCPLVPKTIGGNGGCYVTKMPIYDMVRAIKARETKPWSGDTEVFRGKFVRFGAWGEPVLCPLPIVERIVSVARGHSGYTHLWAMKEYQSYKRYFMASVHDEQQARRAHSLGWRYYSSSRKLIDPSLFPVKTIVCPYETRGIQCASCGLCDGAGRNSTISIQIPAHGSTAVLRGSALWDAEKARVTP